MGKEDQLNAAKRAYRSAKEVGNRQEEARWANVVGDILKNRGEYVEALRWLRIDYEVSVKHLPEKQVLPTCQSIGEVYLRLQSFKEALVYQKKHLELARDAGDLIEQQRASTQLGRTYHEMFLNSGDDHYSIRNAKKYFKLAMKLARTLKDNPPDSRSSFVKEYIDAHNNIGMLEIDLDNFEEAKEILTRGLEICDEEEVDENDDGRTRLHHNLGCVYIELREWRKAQEHIEKDIRICVTIGHRQGEAKGYINLGELHYRIQKYEDAIRCYKKALDLAKSMEDEDALATQINQNINIVKEAKKVMDQLKKEEQKFKKLTRDMAAARGTAHERQCLVRQIASLDSLIDKSSTIFAWPKHLEFAKQKKRVASELGDKERLSDSFLTLGESYEKLRHFKKAIKWFKKSWEICKSIGNLEGQAVAKINIGDVLDSIGDWTEALNAFEEGYRMAIKANLPSVQLSALENMHYSHMIRFDNLEEAQRLQHEIDNLRTLKSKELESKDFEGDCCSETNTEEDNCLSESRSNASSLKEVRKSTSVRSKSLAGVNELSDDVPLVSLIRSRKYSPKRKGAHSKKHNSSDSLEASPNGLSESVANKQTVLGRKRGRLIISDDEGEMNDEMDWSREGFHQSQPNECPVSDESKRKKHIDSSANKFEDSAKVASKFATSSCNPINVEESSCSYKSLSPKMATPTSREMRSLSTNEVRLSSGLATSGSKSDIAVSRSHMRSHRSALHVKLDNLDDDNKGSITFRIDNDLIEVDAGVFLAIDELSLESIKVELSCLYYLQLPSEKRSKGLMPIIQHMTCGGRVLESLKTVEPLKGHQENIHVEVTIKGWVQKRLMKLYIDCCEELSETPNVKLLKKLYISEVEDEVIASECELQDISITPLLKALHAHKTVAMLNLSHNFLGNATMEKLQEFFSSSQKYGDLTLDLHHNRFGPTALFQICECPVLFARLEVLNMSGNRLTDACGSYLSTILENCTALYSLNIERCSITSRTVQKVADALNPGSVLSQLCIGFNSPISGNAMIKLLDKLAALKSFLELNLNGIKLTNPVVDSLCELAKTSCLSRLILGSTGIGTDGAKQLTEAVLSGTHESMTLDLSYCGITPTYIHKLNNDDTLLSGILELNLGGNPSLKEAKGALAAMLMNSACSLKVLVINKCELGLSGIIQIIQALAENECLEELHLADNTDVSKKHKPQDHSTAKGTSDTLQPEFDPSESSSKMCSVKEADNDKQLICSVNTECNQLEVADSEDDPMKVNVSPYELDDTCTSSYQKNSSFKSQFIQELSTAIGLATQLQFLDLSNNYFSTQEAEALYDAWSSRSGTDSTWKHIKDKTVHFSTKTNKCCRIKPCCRRD